MRPELVLTEHTKRWIAERDRSRNATEPRCLNAATIAGQQRETGAEMRLNLDSYRQL
jgi:hypothetical protein